MIGRVDPGGSGAAQAEAIAKQLDNLIDKTEDLRLVWPEVGRAFSERQEEIFRTSSRGRWSPLATSTLIKKSKTSLNANAILVDSGLLRNAATNPQPINAREQSVEFGVPAGDPSRYYASYHIKGSGVPQRNPMPKFTPVERRTLVMIIRRYIQKALDE